MFTLEIKTGGAAFGETSDEAVHEVNRILTEVNVWVSYFKTIIFCHT